MSSIALEFWLDTRQAGSINSGGLDVGLDGVLAWDLRLRK